MEKNQTAREEIHALKLQMLSLIDQFDSILKKIGQEEQRIMENKNQGDENDSKPVSE